MTMMMPAQVSKNPAAMTEGATSVCNDQRNGETLMLTLARPPVSVRVP
jgi:hypothetical protein